MCQDLIRHYTFSQGTDGTSNWKCELLFHHFICVSKMETSIFFSVRDLTIKNVEKVATNVVCWALSLSQQAKIPTVADACNDDTTFRNVCVPLDTVLVLPKSEDWTIPCHATMMLPGTYWAFVESILYSSWNLDAAHVDTGNHRLGEGESRKGKKKTGKKQEKVATQDASANVFLPPHSMHLELECSHFPMLKGRAEDTLCSKKVQRFRWW